MVRMVGGAVRSMHVSVSFGMGMRVVRHGFSMPMLPAMGAMAVSGRTGVAAPVLRAAIQHARCGPALRGQGQHQQADQQGADV